MTLYIVIAVWGAWHLTVFQNKALPTILHPSNLPAMQKKMDVRVLLYSKKPDDERLIPVIKEIGNVVPVELEMIDLPEGYKSAWKDGHAKAYEAGAMTMFCSPDIVWSKGSFDYLSDMLVAGKKVIFMPHLRGTKEAFDGEVTTGEELMRKVLSDEHPVNYSEDVSSPKFTRHPEIVLWPVAGGWICRMFAREPLISDPQIVTFNNKNLPEGKIDPSLIGVVESSDQACGVSLAPREQEKHHWDGAGNRYNAHSLEKFTQKQRSSIGAELASVASLLRYGEINEIEVKDRIDESGKAAEIAFKWATTRPACPPPPSQRQWK